MSMACRHWDGLKRLGAAQLVGLCLSSVLAIGIPSVSSAQADGVVEMTGARLGTVTAVRETSFEINGQEYRLAPDVVIVDRNGNPIEAHAIRVSAEVRYLVKREQPSTIVKMVLYLPQ